MSGEDVLYLSVRELGDRIRTRALSPVELTEAYLERSRKLSPKLNAYATLTPELALKEARQAEVEIKAGKYRGPLHGIPYAAKDLLAVQGYPTTWGAKPYANQRFDSDATVIRRLRDAGAVLVGKAAMIELAGGAGYRFASASATGAAKNPWNTGCWTCGSSSGSGAIVASALAAFAIGTETWGSILCPSSFCGISGHRPTFGRVSRHGAMALAYSMDKIGPMARTADDCGIILAAIAGHDSQDLGSLPAGQAEFQYRDEAARKPFKLGWLKDHWKGAEKGIDEAVSKAVDVLKQQGAQVEVTSLPEGPWEIAAGTVVAVEGAAAFGELVTSGKVQELADPLGQLGLYVGQQVSGDDLLRAQRVRTILQRKIDALFEQFDLLVTASQPVGATTLETNLETDLNYPDPLGGIGNFCGLPAASVPCGFTERKLPVGLQFVGRVGEDATVLEAANLYQRHTNWHRQRPPVD